MGSVGIHKVFLQGHENGKQKALFLSCLYSSELTTYKVLSKCVAVLHRGFENMRVALSLLVDNLPFPSVSFLHAPFNSHVSGFCHFVFAMRAGAYCGRSRGCCLDVPPLPKCVRNPNFVALETERVVTRQKPFSQGGDRSKH